jgi:hypothetical protein
MDGLDERATCGIAPRLSIAPHIDRSVHARAVRWIAPIDGYRVPERRNGRSFLAVLRAPVAVGNLTASVELVAAFCVLSSVSVLAQAFGPAVLSAGRRARGYGHRASQPTRIRAFLPRGGTIRRGGS